jgi:hypothetical protein
VDREGLRDVNRRHPIGVHDHRFGSPLLPRRQRLLLNRYDQSPGFGSTGLSGLQRPSHRSTSLTDAVPRY